MKSDDALKSEVEIISEYFRNTNNSIWLKEGLRGSISSEIDSYNSLIENLQNKRKMFSGIDLTISPFNSSGADFKIIIKNDSERLQLLSGLLNFRSKQINDLDNKLHNNHNINNMENNVFQSKKADLEVKIELPNQEKPFFEKMSTPNNLVNMLQKAGQKLNPNETLRVNLNGTSLVLTKEQTEKPEILQNLETEYNKVNRLKNGHPEENRNLQDLKDQIKYLGFGEEQKVHTELADNLASDKKEFIINISSDKASFKNNEINFELKFQKSEKNENFYLNSFLANLKNNEKDVNLNHTFSANGNFTAKEAINLLEGRSVKTEIYNKHLDAKEDAFVKLQLNEEKNEKGNFKLQVFNKNYGIDIEKIIDKAKLHFDNDKHREITTKSLEKGNIVAVKFSDLKNNIVEGKAILNPQYKMLNLYDNKMKRFNSNEQAFQKDNSETNEVKNQQSHSRKI
ncbi:hypothetical protein [Chryseobacterium gambrini]|nr:hypothetical protein [Chryseobacterium gambrini]